MKLLFTLISISFFLSLQTYSAFAQNLVPNPSFENYTELPDDVGQWWKLENWNSVNNVIDSYPYATPDFFHTNGSGGAQLPNSFYGTISAFEGDGITNIVVWEGIEPNYREYLSTQLISPLEIGATYSVSFYVSNGTDPNWLEGGYGSDGLGAHLSVNPLSQTDHEQIDVTPQVELTGIIYEADWVLIQGEFVATEAFEYITIGNFKDDDNTNVDFFEPALFPAALFFIDQVSVVKQEDPTGVSISEDVTICTGETTTLSASGANSYSWATQDEPTTVLGTSQTLTVSPTDSTVYIITTELFVADIAVHVVDLPTIDLGEDITVCANQIYTIYPNTTYADQYTWSTEANENSLNVSESGTYSVTISNACGLANDEITITFLPEADFQLPNDTVLCGETSFNIDATFESATEYLWQDGSTNSSLQVTESGLYSVAVTDTCNNVLTDSIQVSFNGISAFDLGENINLCENDIIVLDAETAGADAYIWSNGATTAQTTASEAGTYSVTVSDICGQIIVDSLTITTENLPIVNLGGDIELCNGQTTTLNAFAESATEYLWSTGSTNAQLLVNQSGIYSVEVSNNCGSVEEEVSVTIDFCKCKLQVPTAFSPNEDNANDELRAISNCNISNFSLAIYDRWGDLVFETNSTQESWKGKKNGKECDLGVYVWVASYDLQQEDKTISEQQWGNVTLIR